MSHAERAILDKLYDVADDNEADKLDDLRERAGLIWRCKKVVRFFRPDNSPDKDPRAWCGWVNKPESTHCEDCGATRPS